MADRKTVSCELGSQVCRTFAGQKESMKTRNILNIGLGELETNPFLLELARIQRRHPGFGFYIHEVCSGLPNPMGLSYRLNQFVKNWRIRAN